MDVNIREYVKNNFKGIKLEDIKDSIEESSKKGDDITLPGLGVLFEIIWDTSNEDDKGKILNTLLAYFQ